MAEFFTGDLLNHQILEIIKHPHDGHVIMVSPYIKFHQRIMDELNEHKSNTKPLLTVVFGKSAGNYKKSIDRVDLEFLMNYPNVQIRHEERLHAKFYGNGSDYMMSSMNLYDFSQNNNIEFGIKLNLSEEPLEQFEKNASKFIQDVITRSELIYQNNAVSEETTFMGFENVVNSVDRKNRGIVTPKKQPSSKKATFIGNVDNTGYCIRTGEKIKFNMRMPMTQESFRVWSIFKENFYPENYCHCTGENRNGQTSMARPVLEENWELAMIKQKL